MASRGKPGKKLKILVYIDTFQRKFHYAPTFRDIMNERPLNFKTLSHVDYYLKGMREEGLIDYQNGIARSICIQPAGEQLLRQYYASNRPSKRKTTVYVNFSAHFRMDRQRSEIDVPVLGRTFGGPTEMIFSSDFSVSVFDPDNALSVYKDMLPHGVKKEDLFALQVQGPSMIGAGINDGDYILLRRTEQANPGDMVVVWLDDQNETTLKYFFPEKDTIRLEPANPDYKAIIIESERAKSLRIVGKVVLVVRSIEAE